MSKRTRDIGWVSASAAGLALGLLPASVAFALGAGDPVAVPAQPACGPAGMAPFNVPLEPQPEVLKGAPYSGVGTTEVVTTLADGNRITRTNTMRYFRDSVGRTRTEYQLAAIGPFVPEEAQSIVTITDPVAGRHYVLHPGIKRADEFKLAASGERMPVGNAIFVGGAFTSVHGGPTPAAGVATPGLMPSQKMRTRIDMPGSSRGSRQGPAMITSTTGPGTAAVNVAEPMRGIAVARAPAVGVAGAGGTLDVMIVNADAPMAMCRGDNVNATKPVSIGERRIEGLKVTGSRLEFTIEAGAVGNEQPITVRTDQWFSSDLGVVVSSTHHDPMIGDTTYRLEQINRGEPEAALFAIPADYAKQPMGF